MFHKHEIIDYKNLIIKQHLSYSTFVHREDCTWTITYEGLCTECKYYVQVTENIDSVVYTEIKRLQAIELSYRELKSRKNK